MKNFTASENGEFKLNATYDKQTQYFDVNVNIDTDKVKMLKESVLKNYKKHVVKGFRKGKTPSHILEKALGGPESLYSTTFGLYATNKILDRFDNKIIHISDQKIENQGDSLDLKCRVFAEHPLEVDLDLLLGDMNFQIPKIDPDEYVKHRIANFANQNPYLHSKDGIVEDGDMVEIGIEAKIDGKIFASGCSDATSIRITEGSIHPPSLYNNLLGRGVGDAFTIETDKVKDLSSRFGSVETGKKFTMDVKIQFVYICEEPKVDDDLAITAGFDDFNHWKKYLQDSAERITKSREDQLKRQLIIEHLEKCDYPEYPTSWAKSKAEEVHGDKEIPDGWIDSLCKVSRQHTLLKLIGEEINIEWDDADKNTYERNEQVYASKVLEFLLKEKAKFTYVDPGTKRHSKENRADKTEG